MTRARNKSPARPRVKKFWENPYSSSEWKIGSDALFVTCLNNNSEKLEKKLKITWIFFVNTRLNHMPIRSHLVSKSKSKLISNSKQLLNVTNPIFITFEVILPPNLHGQISTNSQVDLRTTDENKNSKVPTDKILTDSGTSGLLRKVLILVHFRTN